MTTLAASRSSGGFPWPPSSAEHGGQARGPAPTNGGGQARGPAPTAAHDKLVRATEKWVAQTFYGTLLKQMHDSPFRSELFEGGRGGRAFSSLYDQHLIDRMAHGAGGKLVRAIVRKFEGKKAYRNTQGTKESGRAAGGANSNKDVHVPNALRA